MNSATATVRADRDYWRWVVGAAALSALLRVRFLFDALSPDEAGAIAFGRMWARGGRPYVDLVVDRPQGVHLLARGWDALLHDHPSTFRLVALVGGAIAVVGCAVIARAVTGSEYAGRLAAVFAAVLSASPVIEGYTANGEMLMAPYTVAGVAVGTLVVVDRLPARWMVASGLLAGLAVSMKQSGFDGLAALGVWLVVAAVCGWRKRSRAITELALLTAGFLVVVVALVLNGRSLGWDAWSYAMWGLRSESRSALTGARWGQLLRTTGVAAAVVGPVVLAAALARRDQAGGLFARSQQRPPHAVVWFWLGTATLGFLTGGNFHRHYWITLTFPVAVMAAMVIDLRRPRWPLRRVAVAAVAAPLALAMVFIAAPGLERKPRIDADVAIADWFDTVRRPGDVIYALCDSPTLYVEADIDPPYRFLWIDHVRYADGATDELVAFLAGDSAPRYVVEYLTPDECDDSGRLADVVAERYAPVTTIDGYRVLELDR